MRKAIVFAVFTMMVSAVQAEVPNNLSFVYGQIHSNTKGIIYLRLDESQPMSSLPDLASEDVGETIKARCINPCSEFAVRDYVSARVMKVDDDETPYEIRRLQQAVKPGYIH